MPSETCDRIRVERYFLEEAGEEEKRATGLHLEACGRCKGQLDSLARERDAYLAARPFPAFAARHLERTAPAASASRARWMPVLAGGLALVALAAILRGPGFPDWQGGSAQPAARRDGGGGPDGIAYKGGESLEFHYRRGGEVKPGRLDEEYRAGDELQFLYAAGKRSHVTLLSVDASGTVSLYREAGSGSASLPAKAGKLEPFPFGVSLDDAGGGELFVALFSQGPIADSAAEAWLSQAFQASGSDAQGGSGGSKAGPLADPGRLAAVEKALRPPAAAADGLVKTLLLRKASP